MAKKDSNIHLDVKPQSEEERRHQAESAAAPDEQEKTVVKNASAAGLGAMERNKQNLPNEDDSLSRY
jgi:ribosome recycling factor